MIAAIPRHLEGRDAEKESGGPQHEPEQGIAAPTWNAKLQLQVFTAGPAEENMAVQNLNTDEGADSRRTTRPGLTAAFLCSVVWLGLNGTDLESWIVGVPSIALAAGVASRFPPARSFRFRWAGLFPFALFFIRQSVLGGWDVARRVLVRRLDIAPGFVTFETTLPPGPARHILLSSISLLPGTLSAGIAGNQIDVHAIDITAEPLPDLRRLEQRIAGLVRSGNAPS
jgi:multicomponent Na+:H+ antiporter subunit E